MATSSKISIRPLYVYMQRPDTEQWLTVGAYWFDETSSLGRFKYAPSYEEAGHAWVIDPVNLIRQGIPGEVYIARRYQGLHDVLRDACPDSWGQAVLKKLHGLSGNPSPLTYLKIASNADRWGALAVGSSPKPSVAALATPRLPKLDAVVSELQAMAARKPAVDARLRARLQQTPSLGGARPKATVQDLQGRYWLVKPVVPNDTANIPMLEHFAQSWGALCGMRFAETHYHEEQSAHTTVRVLRFDRFKTQRTLCVSAASLLQIELPGDLGLDLANTPSYPRLAGQLRLIGAPIKDQVELFERMVFNALCGNDDDHARNHAVFYQHNEGCWRLSPAFDVVPNPDTTPTHLALGIARHEKRIAKDTVLKDSMQFGFESRETAQLHLKQFLERVRAGFDGVQDLLEQPLRKMMKMRMQVHILAK
ncbi:type II toxin-antitoxin system HipA family toxin, partial [Limnobacter sp. P1]|uniref:type II toxin-antitoxin system HipA family toxin n=1 Tax=Limnobacter olei TaxID=3031298 RepID=UPI0023AEC4A1